MTSNYLKRQQMTSSDPEVKTLKSKNRLKRGANIEINDEYLDEILHKNKPINGISYAR